MSIDVAGVGAVANLIQDVADKIWPDPAQKAAAMLQIQQLDNQLASGQAAIDQVEASNNSLFVSGWRPFIGWVCGTALGYHYILEPIIAYIQTGVPPIFDMASLSTILMGMLGLGGLRTVEKMGEKGHLPWQQ